MALSSESLNANYSFKYFGKEQVTVHSFIDERHLLFHSTVFSAAEHVRIPRISAAQSTSNRPPRPRDTGRAVHVIAATLGA